MPGSTVDKQLIATPREPERTRFRISALVGPDAATAGTVRSGTNQPVRTSARSRGACQFVPVNSDWLGSYIDAWLVHPAAGSAEGGETLGRLLGFMSDGVRYAFESVGTGTNTGAVGPIPATGLPFVLRGTSVGSISRDGLVESHRDYWDMAGFLVQLGVLPGPSA